VKTKVFISRVERIYRGWITCEIGDGVIYVKGKSGNVIARVYFNELSTITHYDTHEETELVIRAMLDQSRKKYPPPQKVEPHRAFDVVKKRFWKTRREPKFLDRRK